MISTTNRIAAYKRKTAELYADDPAEFQCRFMAGIAIQKRVSQGKRKLRLVHTSQKAATAAKELAK